MKIKTLTAVICFGFAAQLQTGAEKLYMSNEAIRIRELPTLDFIMNEIYEQQAQTGAAENQTIFRFFYRLAASQILQIIVGAILVFLIAPASLFVSRTENEAFVWIVAGITGIVFIALGLIVILLSIIAANAFRKEKSWRKLFGIAASGIAIFAFPLGTILGAILLLRIFKDGK